MDCYDELGNRYQLPIYVLSAPVNLVHDAPPGQTVATSDDDDESGARLTLRLRLSTGEDVRLDARTSDSVMRAKRRLGVATAGGGEGVGRGGVEAARQRWYYGGRLLADRTRLADIRVPKGHVVQVVVADEEDEDDGGGVTEGEGRRDGS